MIDYILDNMAVGNYELHRKASTLRNRNVIEFTICEEISHEQRLATDDDHRKAVKAAANTLSSIDDLGLLAKIANEMIDIGALDLDEGGGDVMVIYEAVAVRSQNLFVEKRIVVSDDTGVQTGCDNHEQKWISTAHYRAVLEEL